MLPVHRSVVLSCAALVLCACSPDKGFGETKEVTADDYGSAWPLTVDTAKVNKVCDGDAAVAVVVDGKTFVISGLDKPDAANSGFLDYWLKDESQESGRKDLAPLVAEGESLCE
jgi:hypothetical protein